MVFFENFRVAFSALRANKMRSILTALGIIIGVAAVVAVVSIVQGLQFMISRELEGVGATFIIVDPKFPQVPGIAARQVKLTWEDGLAIRERVPRVRFICPVLIGQETVKYRDRQHTPDFIFGTNQDWPEVANYGVEHGRFFSRIDLEGRKKVAVIGSDVVEELKLGREPLGKEIYIGKYPATIIGVMEDKGQALGMNYDDLVYLPFDSAVRLFGRQSADLVRLRLHAETASDVEQVKDQIKALLRQRHKIPADEPDDFQIATQDEILETTGAILGGVTAVVGGVVGIALLVGGIGIMNIMLVSVTERTREIGTRKAVGARRQDVLVQFLIEAVTLSLFGGIVGLLLGYGLGVAATAMLPGDFPPAHVPFWAVAIAFGFSTLVGVFFGIYPAAKAARLDPIEALRYE
ncbi:MAG TPA: ABC transporter permease [Thermoanaerobaculia bacterium]